MNFIYKIVTLDGRKLEVEAPDGEAACKLLAIAREDCKKWYPAPLRVVLTDEEITVKQAALEKLRSNPVYQQNKQRKKKLKQRIKKFVDRVMVNKGVSSLSYLSGKEE